jgi:nicotinamide-nucleotide adenylyltransferase
MPAYTQFFDFRQLLRLRRIVRELDPDGSPRAVFLPESDQSALRRLALLPGSFNPPTKAHLALAGVALATGSIDRLDFLLASRTVNKEQIQGASLSDRLLLLEALVDGRPELGVVLVNRGLYVDQAEIIRAALPSLDELTFVVGFDKIVQIFDPRYYQDRDSSLDRLFALARFLVAPRGSADIDDLRCLLERSENRRYANRISPLELDWDYRQMSSSRLRAHEHDALHDAPRLVLDFARETGAYGGLGKTENPSMKERYSRREHILDVAETGLVHFTTPAAFRLAVLNSLPVTEGSGRPSPMKKVRLGHLAKMPGRPEQ